MVQEIGESREAWGWNVVRMVEDFANNMKSEEKPFYIVYACKPHATKKGWFMQGIKAYFAKPQPILGILVWYVNNKTGEFRFEHELSAPPDIPLDPKLLSDKVSDTSDRVANQGQKLNVLVS